MIVWCFLYYSIIISSVIGRCVTVDVRAKQAEINEITPQTDYVTVHYDGWCVWQPRFELSVVHCYVDITWFPFDAQICHLYFESWMLRDNELDISVLRHTDIYEYYCDSDEWNLTGACEKPLVTSLPHCNS